MPEYCGDRYDFQCLFSAVREYPVVIFLEIWLWGGVSFELFSAFGEIQLYFLSASFSSHRLLF
jgi:hypothetical protein